MGESRKQAQRIKVAFPKGVAEAKSTEVTGPQQMRKSIGGAAEAYLSVCKSREIKRSTLARYKTLTNQLEQYCKKKGYTYTDKLQVMEMAEFYAGWEDAKEGKS